MAGASGSGKTVLLATMALDIDRGCFARAVLWGPSLHVDSTWRLVKDYIRDPIKPHGREKCSSDRY